VWRSSAISIGQQSGSFGNDADYDLFNGAISSFSGAQANGIVGTPTYETGHGWSNWGGGNYQLKPGTPGHDKGARLPNFNDGYTGNGPDVGAHEHGTAPMRLGISGSGGTWAGSTGGGTTTTTSGGSTSTTGGDTGGTTAGGGGLCSTISCAAQ